MSLPLAVDSEELILAWLRDHASVAAIVEDRAFPAIPPDPTYPLLVVRRVAGRRIVRDRLDAPRIQIDAYAATKADAWELAATVQAALPELVGVHMQGVVTGVDEMIGPTWMPDPVTNQPRYTQDYMVYTHP